MARSAFAGTRREAVQAVAEAVGGSFREGKWMGGYGVKLEHDPFTLHLDLKIVNSGASNTTYTRVSAVFSGRDPLRFTARPKTFLDRIAGKIGFAGLPVGDREFARRYVVRGRPSARVRSILSGGLASALAPPVSFRVEVGRARRKHRKKLGASALQVQVLAPGVDTDVDRMLSMFAVAREALDVLRRMGAASGEPAL